MKRDDLTTILQMVIASQAILDHVGDQDRAAFLSNSMARDAILYQLTILGEVARRLSDGLKESHPEIPWRLIQGMRNWLVHRYDNISLERVWTTVSEDVPALLSALDSLHSSLSPPGDRPGV